MANEFTTTEVAVSSATAAGGGATITPIYAERSVRTYAIPEPELDSIGVLNLQVQLWTSLGTGFAFLVLNCLHSTFLATTPPPEATKLMCLYGALAFVCYVMAAIHQVMKKGRLLKIKQESGEAPLPLAQRVLANAFARQIMLLYGITIAAIGIAMLFATAQPEPSLAMKIVTLVLLLFMAAPLLGIWWYSRPKK